MSKPEVGQTIYVRAEKHEQNTNGFVSFTVIKVGRLYYHVGHKNEATGRFYGETRFRIEDNMEEVDIGRPRRAFFSEQEFLDEQERMRRFHQLRGCFNWTNDEKYTLEQLREVCSILGLAPGESETAEGGYRT